MIRFRGNVLRTPTLQLRREYQTLKAMSWVFGVSGCGAVGSAHGWGP